MNGISSFSINKLDVKLAECLRHRNGSYVEIGANNGIQQSNSKYFETFKGWRGVLIEPAIDNFIELKRNRNKGNYFANYNCVPFDYSEKYVNLIYSDLMTTSIGLENDLESMEKQIGESKKYLKRGTVHSFQAKACTMNKILVESTLPNKIEFPRQAR